MFRLAICASRDSPVGGGDGSSGVHECALLRGWGLGLGLRLGLWGWSAAALLLIETAAEGTKGNHRVGLLVCRGFVLRLQPAGALLEVVRVLLRLAHHGDAYPLVKLQHLRTNRVEVASDDVRQLVASALRRRDARSAQCGSALDG